MPKEVIIVRSEKDSKDQTVEAWGSLTRVCKEYDCFPYHTLKILKFPFTFAGFKFTKVKYNSKHKLK
jgi:hypothetical protein